MVSITRIRPKGVGDTVHEALRRAILDQVFRPGERLEPESLAIKFGVSLTPIRQALQKLSAAGLVEIRPRSGTFVARITPQDVAETFDIRRALECLAAEGAVRNLTDPALRRLETLVAEMRCPLETEKDRELHQKRNTEFHRLLIELAGNRKLAELYNELNAHIKIARIHLGSRDWSRRTDQEQREHEQILEALRRREAAALAEALARHINRAKNALIADLEAGS